MEKDERYMTDDVADLMDDIAITKEEIESSISLGGSDWTSDTIANQIRKGNIKLDPKFQRRDAWTQKRKSAFVESLVLNLPVPQIVLAEHKGEKGKYIVIDGKQRLLTLVQFFGLQGYKPLKLNKLTVLKDLNGKTYGQIKSNLTLSDYIASFENATIRTVVIKNWKRDNILYDIFLRLNSNSVGLSPQELRQALHPGNFTYFAEEFTSSNKYLLKMFNNKEPDFRMRDIELFIRYVAFSLRIGSYSGNYKVFLDDTCVMLNKDWDNYEEVVKHQADQFNVACKTTYDIFRDNAFRKWLGAAYENRFNRAVFDVMAYYFSDDRIVEAALQNKSAVEDAFRKVCANFEFLQSIERTIKSISATSARLSLWGEALKTALPGCDIVIPSISGGARDDKKI